MPLNHCHDYDHTITQQIEYFYCFAREIQIMCLKDIGISDFVE
uniref:Uncharacterized protein n=1 Tax=Rhizophora mucronata TaxID=61149 RepID=A0A2P2QP22_RHIMU